MSKEFIGVRISSDLHDKLKSTSNATEETFTEIVERALSEYLDHDVEGVDVFTLERRLRTLESKFDALYSSGVVIEDKPKYSAPKRDIMPEDRPGADEFGDLITKKEASDLTGYSTNTLNRTFSQQDIKEVSKRGKAGLYRKSEVMDRIGLK